MDLSERISTAAFSNLFLLLACPAEVNFPKVGVWVHCVRVTTMENRINYTTAAANFVCYSDYTYMFMNATMYASPSVNVKG